MIIFVLYSSKVSLKAHSNTPRQFLMFQTKVSTCKLSEATKHIKEGFLLAERV